MNTAGSSSGSFGLTSATQGYAVPINEALSVANQIESGHSSSTVHVGPTAFLGVLISSSAQDGSGNGAAISSAVTGGPAAQAGLTAWDTINSINGQTVTSATDLGSIIGQYSPGTKVQVG
jgi:S1-C subfamily serine protease